MKRKAAFLSACLLIFQIAAFSSPFGERIVRQGAADLQENLEHVSGELYLTETTLVFESSGLNFQGGATTIYLGNIATVEKGWSKLLGIIPAVPNALKITTRDGKVYRFTCWWPSRWKKAVEQQIALPVKA